MDPKFNPHLESLLCRISEANDLGDDDRFAFYDRRKAWMVSPPNVLSVADKNIKLHPVVNVTGIVISSNDKGGLYLPPDDRRHFVAWSECKPSDFEPSYFTALYDWYDKGGVEHVNAYLRALDLSGFDPKAPPSKTPAFWEIVNSSQSTEASELDDLLDYMNQPFDDERPVVVTIAQLVASAAHRDARGRFEEVLDMLQERKARKSLVHKLGRSGYSPVRNEAEKEGRWKVAGKHVMVYGRKDVSMRVRLDAARKLINEMFVSDAEEQRKARAARKLKPAA
jgi:hypothetical protein